MATLASMACGAQQKVFQTYELLEQVLLHLPLRDSLLAQGINKAWWDVVQRSEDIKKALFLAPGVKLPHQREERRRIFNPFIKMHNLNSMLEHTNTQRKRLLKEEDAVFISEKNSMDPRQPRHFFACQRGAPLVHKYQSRHSMFASHPPARRMTLADSSIPTRRRLTDTKFNTTGITYEDLLGGARTVWEKSGKKTPGMYYLEGADAWLQFAGTIHTITGFEMLGMLGTDVQELLDEGLVVVQNGVDTSGPVMMCGYSIMNHMS